MSRRPGWWTPADQAEFDAITHVLFWGLAEHEARCRACQEQRYCRHASAALGFAVLWRERRGLLSKAEYLRRAQQEKPV